MRGMIAVLALVGCAVPLAGQGFGAGVSLGRQTLFGDYYSGAPSAPVATLSVAYAEQEFSIGATVSGSQHEQSLGGGQTLPVDHVQGQLFLRWAGPVGNAGLWWIGGASLIAVEETAELQGVKGSGSGWGIGTDWGLRVFLSDRIALDGLVGSQYLFFGDGQVDGVDVPDSSGVGRSWGFSIGLSYLASP